MKTPPESSEKRTLRRRDREGEGGSAFTGGFGFLRERSGA